MIIIAVCVLVPAGLWTIRDLAPSSADYAVTVVSVVVAILAILAPQLPSFRAARPEDLLDQALSDLATALEEQWREEESVRGADPFPLPVRFKLVTDPVLTPRWDAIAGLADAPPVSIEGTFTEIADVFRSDGSPRRLVVLGEVGAGKSALVMRLTLDLLRTRTGADPVPVLLSVASWDPGEDLEDWVAARLGEQYPGLSVNVAELGGRSRSIARALLARLLVLPVLDGLDEMAAPNRGRALQQLSAAVRRGQHLVVTCRAREYRELLATEDQEPLERTPVVELAPVMLADIRAYLLSATMPPVSRWDRVLDYLESEPQGVLSEVLSTPLMIWLARMVYKRSRTDPSELIGLATHADRVRQHLLDGLIPAAYAEQSRISRYPKRTGQSLEQAQLALNGLASYLQTRKKQNLAWWLLHEEVSGALIATFAALATGCVLGAAAGYAVSVKAGPAAGLIVGLANAVVGGVLCGVTVMLPQEMPRVLNFRFSLSGLRFKLLGGLTAGPAIGLTFGYACERGGGPWAGILVFLVVTPVSALGVGSVFGTVSGITGGTSAGLAFGLAAGLVMHRSSGVAAGVTTGAVFTVMSWIWTGLYQPTAVTRAVSPDFLFRGDRTSSLVVGLTSGIAYGIACAFALGPWIGALATVVFSFAVAMTVSTWGQFGVTRIWLAHRRKAPFAIMKFLREAHERGVIRQNGMYY